MKKWSKETVVVLVIAIVALLLAAAALYIAVDIHYLPEWPPWQQKGTEEPVPLPTSPPVIEIR